MPYLILRIFSDLLLRYPIFRFASQVPHFQICFSGTPFSVLLLRYPSFRFASQVPQFQICFSGTLVSDLLLRCPYLLLILTITSLIHSYAVNKFTIGFRSPDEFVFVHVELVHEHNQD